MQKHILQNVNFKSILLSCFSVSLFTGCQLEPINERWEIAVIEPKIAADPGFRLLDQQKEVFSFGDTVDSSEKRTSGAAYFSGDLSPNDKFNHLNNCRAYFVQGDTLAVFIGIGNGFSGEGFVIRIKNGRFFTRPYYYSDAGVPREKSTYKSVYQKLILDKPGYAKGDSIYGRIEFRSIENSGYFSKIKYIASGIFRARIKERF